MRGMVNPGLCYVVMLQKHCQYHTIVCLEREKLQNGGRDCKHSIPIVLF